MTKRIGYAVKIAIIMAVLLTISVSSFFSNTPILAQDEQPEPVVIAGSLYLEGLVQQLVGDYQASTELDADFEFAAAGNDAGYAALCSGEADLVMTTRDISDEEILNCGDNGVEFIETLLAVEGLVMVPNVGVTQDATCVLAPTLPDILGAGAPEVLSWFNISSLATVSGQVNLYGPESDSAAVTLLTALLPDNLPRTDYETFASISDVLDLLSDPISNTLAFTTIAEWDAVEDKGDVVAFNVGAEDFNNCVEPSAETIASSEYDLGRRLYLYVGVPSLENPAVGDLLDFAYTEQGAIAAAAELGFTSIDDGSANRSVLNVNDTRTGRTFTRANTPVEFNTAEAGELTIGGAGLAESIASTALDNFSETYIAVTLNKATFGNAAGWEALCNGEVNVIEVTRQATAEEQSACEANGIDPTSVYLGGDAVVLIVDGSNDELPTCLAYDDVRTLLARQDFDPQNDQTIDVEAEGENDTTDPQGPTNWNAVSDLDAPLVILPAGEHPGERDLPFEIVTLETDLMFSVIAPGEAILPRNDAPTVQPTPRDSDLDDIIYRLGAIANYEEGEALAYMLLSELTANNDGEVNVQALDIGPDCVSPNAETIASGEYPFSLNSYLVFSPEALKDPVAASLLWQTYSNDVLDLLEESGLVGFDRSTFAAQRDAVFNAIAEAQAIAAAEAEADAETETSDDATNTEDDTDTSVEGDDEASSETDGESTDAGAEDAETETSDEAGDDTADGSSDETETDTAEGDASTDDGADGSGSETDGSDEDAASDSEDGADN